VLQWSTVGIFTALAMSFWFLQVVQHARYEEMAENNHQRTLALRAPRGVLFDRNGAVLVENRHSFTISIVREHSKDLARTVQLLSQVAHLDARRSSRSWTVTSPSRRTGRSCRRGRDDGAGGGGHARGSIPKLPDVVVGKKCRRALPGAGDGGRICSATSARRTTRR
jgi:cell division protein FtsI/penicillin-binding protein 2